MKLNIGVIRLDGGTQPRASLDESVVVEYFEAMVDGAVFPPITVFHDGSNYWLADGFHRYHASKRAGVLEVECQVQQGTKRDAVKYSLGANAHHGLRRSHEDKRRVVLTVLNDVEWSDLSDRDIAKTCNVSHPFVGRMRKSLEIDQKPAPKKEVKIAPEVETIPPEQDKLQELATEHIALAEENQKLQDRLASKVLHATEEEQNQALSLIDDLRSKITQLEAENAALKVSRDEYQMKASEYLKQMTYWKRRAEKSERQAA